MSYLQDTPSAALSCTQSVFRRAAEAALREPAPVASAGHRGRWAAAAAMLLVGGVVAGSLLGNGPGPAPVAGLVAVVLPA